MHSKTDNIEVMPYDNLIEVIKDIFVSFLSRHLNWIRNINEG